MKTILMVLVLLFKASVSAVDECYFCKDWCEEPLERHKCREEGFILDIDFKCYTIENNSSKTRSAEKGCLPADFLDAECAKMNQLPGATCAACDSDLCNGLNHRGTSSAVSPGAASGLLLTASITRLFF